ncbi:MAG: DUF4363 family protein [Oscillospiraceae bacterium]|jgi:hypothetical protein|nr:DUF4363 family protein [Oscillospiraceae bacterium]
MKKTHIAILFFLITIMVCVTNFYLIKNATQTAENYLEEIINLKDQSEFSKATQKCIELNKIWDKKIKILSIFIHHESLDRITQSLKVVNASLENESSLETSKSSISAITYLKALRESEKISLENIF